MVGRWKARPMNKQNLYVSLLNALAGILFSLLLKGNLLIYVLAFIIGLTIVFIERNWIYENVFKRKKRHAVAGYSALFLAVILSLVFLTQPKRDRSQIVETVHGYLDQIKAGDYKKAYEDLSEFSKKNYPLDTFVSDHVTNRLKIQDYRIDDVAMNEFDKKKAVVQVSSPFLIYGQNTLPLEMVKEATGWKIVFSRGQSLTAARNPTASQSPKKKDGAVGQFFKKIF